MDAATWHKVLRRMWELVNASPEAVQICKELGRLKMQFEVRGKPEYDFALEFSDKGAVYRPGSIPDFTTKLNYPDLEVLIETLGGKVSPFGTHAVMHDVILYGHPTRATAFVGLAYKYVPAFYQAMASVTAPAQA